MGVSTPDPGATLTLAQGATVSSVSNPNSDLTNLTVSSDLLNTDLASADLSNSLGSPTTADSAMSSNAPSQDFSSTVNIDVPSRSENLINNNCLDPYIDVIYNISLGMVSYAGVTKLRQSNGSIDEDILSTSDYVIFASTADAKTDNKNYNGDYYNIQKLVFTSFLGHLPQNPMTAFIWDGKMTIFEPYGFNFPEDMDDLANQLGYQATSRLDYVYRIEIWFSGYDPVTGDWVSQIEIPVHDNKNINSVVYYLVITTVEAKVTPTGTFYDLSFQINSHYATRAEAIVMHQDSIGIKLEGDEGTKFGSFLALLAQRLHDQVWNDTQHQIDITYQFYGLQALFDAVFVTTTNIDFSSGVSFDTNSGAYVSVGKAIDIFTLANQVMGALDLVQQLLLREDNPEFTNPGVMWNIRTNISESQDFNQYTNCYRKYTFQYIIEPVLTFRSRTVEYTERNMQVTAGNQQARVNAMANYGMIVRKYDYLFTEDNSEIIDFQFMFKNFYYAPFPYPGPEVTPRGHSHNTDDQNAQSDINAQKQIAATDQSDNSISAPNLLFSATNQNLDLNSILGIPANPQSSLNSRNPSNINNYMHRSPSIPASQNTTLKDIHKTKFNTARDQYYRYDMINGQMTIRFDPVWLLNPYMSGKDFTPTLPENSQYKGIFAYAYVDRVVYIRAYRPNQASFMNPDRSVSFVKSGPILGGFYQVLSAINEFDGGKFFQKLNMFKYDHLNYYNEPPSSQTNSGFTTQPGTTAGLGAGVIASDPGAGSTVVTN